MCLEGIEPTPNRRPNQIVQRVKFRNQSMQKSYYNRKRAE